jgi:membrane protein required for beta-lactamase induction
MKFLDTTWPPRDWRALIALFASIGGAIMLTVLLAWVIRIFQNWHIPDPLANIAYGLLAIIGIILMSLGLAINRRSVKASGLGFSLDATGGDDAATPTVTTTTTTAVAPGATTETTT